MYMTFYSCLVVCHAKLMNNGHVTFSFSAYYIIKIYDKTNK